MWTGRENTKRKDEKHRHTLNTIWIFSTFTDGAVAAAVAVAVASSKSIAHKQTFRSHGHTNLTNTSSHSLTGRAHSTHQHNDRDANVVSDHEQNDFYVICFRFGKIHGKLTRMHDSSEQWGALEQQN